MAWHEGELAMQERAGVRALADRVGRIISADIPPVAAAFLAAQPFVIVSTVDAAGQPTASLLGGAPGFASASDSRTLTIAPAFGHDVFPDVEATGAIGILAIDPATRRRMRVNGTAVHRGDALVVTTREVYSNCPQYITPRAFAPKSLAVASRDLIGTADTFFLATSHPEHGADASHRGGAVRIESPTRLSWPDLPGNNMFNSLGNLLVNPRCGLLFVDFARAAALQLRGRAAVEGDAERVVVFEFQESGGAGHRSPTTTPSTARTPRGSRGSALRP